MAQTLGQYLVNDLLPSDLRTTASLDKKKLYERLYTHARRDPEDAAKRMDKLRALGHEISTTEGISISLDDITPNYGERDKIMKPALTRIKKIQDPGKRRAVILDTQKKLEATTRRFPGSQGEFLRSGGRGAPSQLMRSFIAPVASRTVEGGTYPWLITRSHSEGLKPSEMFVTNKEARNNALSAYISITEPGDFSKILVNNMGNQLVLSEDCGTKNGILLRSDDPNIVDRYLAEENTLITPQIFSQLRKKGRSVLVRSPMTCEHNDGICARCQGRDEKGNLHSLGTNVGIRAAQAITEPLTQFSLSAKHAVRQAGEDKTRLEGLKGLRSFLEVPKSFTNSAVLTPVAGKVSRIEKAPQGGHNVYVGEETHYVPPHLAPVVSVDQKVTPGDALSDGIPMPNEVVKYKGLGAGRKYIVERLHDVYKDQGLDIDKRHFEILARSHLNHVQIEEDPAERFYPGEIVNYTTLMRSLAEDTENVSTKDATGRILGKPYLHHLAGTTISPEIVSELAKSGKRKIQVAMHPPRISFVMYPITTNPLLNPDWMARLAHRRLKDSILEGVHFGQKTNLHGAHPVPAYLFGREFGKGPGGLY